MNNKIELANPIDTNEIKISTMISFVVIIVFLMYEYIVRGRLSWLELLLSACIIVLITYVWNYRQFIIKPKSIEIEENRLVLHFRFKSKPVIMRLEDIGYLDISLDGSKIGDWIGFDAILTFKEKKPVAWFPLYWKSAIIVREHYKSRFGEYPSMREGFVKK